MRVRITMLATRTTMRRATALTLATVAAPLTGPAPVSGADYDGDGRTDLAVWRPANATWYAIRSSDGQQLIRPWGATRDIPISGSGLPDGP